MDSLDFDDVPFETKDSAPSSDLNFDDVPIEAPTSKPAPKNRFRYNANTPEAPAKPVERKSEAFTPTGEPADPFANESALSTAKRRGQQFATSAVETFASAPEGVSIANRIREREVQRSSRQVLKDFPKEKAELEAIIQENQTKADQGDWEAKARVNAAKNRLTQVEGQMQMAGNMDEQSTVELATPLEKSFGFEAGRAMRQGTESLIGKPDPRDKSFSGKLASGAGSLVGFVAATVAGSVAAGPAGGTITGGTLGATSTASQMYKEAIDAGASEEDALKASKWGFLIGGSEVVPILTGLKFIPAPFKVKLANGLVKKVAEIAESSGEEAVQEYLSQVAQNLTGYEDKPWDEGAAEGALIGAILGGGTGAIGAIKGESGAENTVKPKIEPITERGANAAETAALNATQQTVSPPAPVSPAAREPAEVKSGVSVGENAPDVTAAVAAASNPAAPPQQSQAERIKAISRARQAAQAPTQNTATEPVPSLAPVAEGPQVGGVPAAPPAPDSLARVGEGGKAIISNMYDMLWGKVQKGETTEAGGRSTILEAAKKVREQGGLQNPDDFRAFAQEIAGIPSGPGYSDRVREVMGKYAPSPEAASAPAAPPAPEAAPPQSAAAQAVQGLDTAREDRAPAQPGAVSAPAPTPTESPAKQAADALPPVKETTPAPTTAPSETGGSASPVTSEVTPAPEAPKERKYRTVTRRDVLLDAGIPAEQHDTMKSKARDRLASELRAKVQRETGEKLEFMDPAEREKALTAAWTELQQVREKAKTEAQAKIAETKSPEPKPVESAGAAEEVKPGEERSFPGEEPAKREAETLAPNGRRVLRGTTEEAKARDAEAKRLQDERDAKISAENAAADQRAQEEQDRIALGEEDNAPAVSRASKEGKAEIARRENNKNVADNIVATDEHNTNKLEDGFEKNTDKGTLARNAVVARARRMVERAQKLMTPGSDGRVLPQRLKMSKDTVLAPNTAQMILFEAERLARKEKPTLKDVTDFRTNEVLLRAGMVDEYLSSRVVEGDIQSAPQATQTNKDGEVTDAVDRAASADLNPEQNLEAREEGDDESQARANEAVADQAPQERPKVTREVTEGVDYTAGKAKAPKVETKSKLSTEELAKRKAAAKALTSAAKAAADAPARPKLALKQDTTVRANKGNVTQSSMPRIITKTMTMAEAMDRLDPGSIKLFGDKNTQKIIAAILGRLKEAVPDLKIIIIPHSEMMRVTDGGAAAYFDPKPSRFGKNGYIAISSKYAVDGRPRASLVAHEGLHALFSAALANDPELHELVTSLGDYVRGSFNSEEAANEHYGLTIDKKTGRVDPHEFLSEALSEAEFQEILRDTPIPDEVAALLNLDKNEDKTVWGALRSMVRDLVLSINRSLFGGGDEYSVLDAVMEVGGRLDKMGTEIRKRRGDTAVPAGPITEVRYSKEKQLSNWNKLLAGGVPRDVAKAINDHIKEELGKTIDPATLPLLIEDYIAEFGKAKATSESNPASQKAKVTPEASARKLDRGSKELRKELESQVNDFVPAKNPGKRGLLWATSNIQLGMDSDDFFGRYTNPIRKVAEAIEARRVRKQALRDEMLKPVAKLAEARDRYIRGKAELRRDGHVYTTTKKQSEIWNDFTSLMNDATIAEVHPDRPLEGQKHLKSEKALGSKWARAQHADLSSRYNALPDDLKQLWQETRDLYTESQNRMNYGRLKNILELSGHGDSALIQRFFDKTATEADKKLVGVRVADLIENSVELAKIDGPYFTLARRGDYRVQGTYKVDVPANAKALSDSEFEFNNRDEAVAFAEKQKHKSSIQSVYVDKSSGEQYVTDDDGTEVKISKNDTDAEQRFRVTVQNRHVEFADNPKEARRIAEQLRADGLDVDDVVKRTENVGGSSNADQLSEQMKQLAATLKSRKEFSDLSDAQRGELEGVLQEVSLRYLGSTRIQSRFIRRRGIEGASTDAVRNAYDYVDAASGYLAKLEVQPDIDAGFKDADEKLSRLAKQGTGAGEGASEILAELKKRAQANIEESNGAIDVGIRRLTQLAFLRYLASPAYTMLQTIQPHLTALPYLAGEYGEIKAIAQFNRAYIDVSGVRILANGAIDTVKALSGSEGSNHLDDVKSRLKNPREREMLDELARIGFIDADAGMMVARNLKREDSFLGKYYDPAMAYVDNIGRQGPKAAEALNRTAVALMAYRLAMGKHKDHAKAIQDAKDAVDLTQGTYSQSNQAPIFRSRTGRVALQFKKYGQMMYYMLGKQFARAWRNLNPGDRKSALKGLAYTLAIHQLVAGTMGLPFEAAKVLVMALNGLGVTDDDWDDAKDEMEKFYAWLTGSMAAAEMLTYGVTRGLGKYGFDLSTRVGLDGLLTFGSPDSYKEADVKSYLWDTVTGAAGSMVSNVVKATSAAVDGDWSKAVNALPLKFAVDVGQAVRKSASGEYTGPEGLIKGFGLTPASQARASAAKTRQIKDRKELRQNFEDALSRNDRPAQMKIIAAIRNYNDQLRRSKSDGAPLNVQRIRSEWMSKKRRERRAEK